MRVTLPGVQKVVGPLGVIVADGVELTVTVVGDDVALQPAGSVTVTVKLPEVVTTIDWVLAPFDQE